METNRANPIAASQAANTRIVVGIINESVNWELREANEIIRNKESIIPSIHRSVDIMCDRKVNVPSRERKKANIRFRNTRVIWYLWIKS